MEVTTWTNLSCLISHHCALRRFLPLGASLKLSKVPFTKIRKCTVRVVVTNYMDSIQLQKTTQQHSTSYPVIITLHLEVKHL
jgi:hypothetical protein